MRVVDQFGQVLDKPDNEAWEGLVRGLYGLQPGSDAAVHAPNGGVERVAAQDLGAALSAGYTPAAEAEWTAAELQAKYGGAGYQALAGGAGVARGATLGLSDVAATALGGETVREALSGAREANPWTSLGGELVGAVAPAFLTGGESAAASGGAIVRAGSSAVREASALETIGRAVTTPTRWAARAGELGSEVVGGAMGADALLQGGLASRMAARAIPGVVGGTIEGAIQGAGQVVTEMALGNPDVSAERLIASGAIMGGALGGVLGIGRAALFDRGAGFAAKEGAQEVGTERVKGWLQQYAERKAVKSTGASDRDFRELELIAKRNPEARERIPQMLLNEFPAEAGHTSIAGMRTSEIRDVAGAVREATGERLGSVLRQLDTAATIEHQPDVIGIVERGRRVSDELRKMPGASSEAKKVDAYLDDLLDKSLGTGLEDLHKARVWLDKEIYSANKLFSTSEEPLKKIRGIIEDEITRSADAAADALGGEMIGAYKAAKVDYAAAKWIEKAAEGGARRLEKNRSISLGDHLFGAMGAVLGVNFGALSGMATAAAASATSNLIRNRGNQFVAGALHAIVGEGQQATLRSAREAIQLHVQARSQAIQTALRGELALPSRALPERAVQTAGARAITRYQAGASDRERYERMREAVQSISATPGLIKNGYGRLGMAAPKVADAASQNLLAQVHYLQSHMPRIDANPGKKPRASEGEMRAWLRRADAAGSPLTAIHSQTPEAIDAVRTLYPYEVGDIIRHLSDEEPSAKRDELLAKFSGTPTGQTDLQSTIYPPQQQQAARLATSHIRADRYKSASQALDELEQIT